MGMPVDLPHAIERLYDVLGQYSQPLKGKWCEYCNSPEEIRVLETVPLRELDETSSWSLLRESWDHWESVEVYKHYLPRILEVLAPPFRCEDLYPEHLFEGLHQAGFRDWPEPERAAILAFVTAMEAVGSVPEELASWRTAAGKLTRGEWPGL